MIYQLRSVNVDILTDRDIDVSNQIIPVVETFYCYHLTISPANNRTIHTRISNSTINNVHIYLDNGKISAHITNNVFTGAGIKISSTSTDLHQPVIIENSIFQGFYFKTIFKVLNTTNVYLYSCVFNNSKLVVLPEIEDNEKSGMLCFNSQINLHHIAFQGVSFFLVAAFENCTLAINQLTVSGNSLLLKFLRFPYVSETNSLLYLKHSKAIIEDGKFEDNTQVHCFWIVGGNTTLHNVMFDRNNKVEYGRFVHATVDISNTSVVNNTDSNFYISLSTVSISSCKFLNTSIRSRYYLMKIMESYVSISHCFFRELEGAIGIFIFRSQLFIRGSHFLQMKNSSHFIYFERYSVQSLHILHCRFESNEIYSRFIDVTSGSAIIHDTLFHNNRVTGLIEGKSIELTNCVFNSNFASLDVVLVNNGTVQFSNCSFSYNVFTDIAGSLYHSLVDVRKGQLIIDNCTFANNSSPYGLGVITLEQNSSLLVESSIFVNNSYNGGVIRADGNCTLKMSYIIFENNKAQIGYGAAVFLGDKSRLETDSCRFIGNRAKGGGSIIVVGHSSYSYTRSIFTKNTAAFGGGAVMIIDHSSYTDTESTFMNNTVGDNGGGGAISITLHSFLRLENSTIEYNSCAVEGGAIRVYRNSSLNVSHSIFRNNKALGAEGGAIILEDESSLESDSCQFQGNTAALGGGAVMVVDHSSYSDIRSNFTNNIAADNGTFTKCFFKNQCYILLYKTLMI